MRTTWIGIAASTGLAAVALFVAPLLIPAELTRSEARAQEADGAPAPPPPLDPGADSTVLRTRGVSAWQNYVWSLDKSRLAISVEELERAEQLDGRTEFTQLYLTAFGHLVLGDEEAGRRALKAVRDTGRDFVANLLLDAFEDVTVGANEEALEKLDRFVAAVESAPRETTLGAEFRYLAYLHRGAHRYTMGQHGGAVTDLRTAARIAREEGRVPATNLILRIALAHQSLEEHGAATELVEELLHRDPGNADLYYNRGLLEGTQKRLPEARAWYEKAVARKRDHVDAHGKLAFLAWRDAEDVPSELTRTRSELSIYAALTRDGASARTLADVESGLGAYWLVVARHRVTEGREPEAAPAYEAALTHFESALRHAAGCMRALNSIIQIGNELGWPPDRIAPYRERLKKIQDGEEGAPEAQRTSFC